MTPVSSAPTTPGALEALAAAETAAPAAASGLRHRWVIFWLIEHTAQAVKRLTRDVPHTENATLVGSAEGVRIETRGWPLLP